MLAGVRRCGRVPMPSSGWTRSMYSVVAGKHSRVAVVGGGVSGLSCAWSLCNAGIPVLLIAGKGNAGGWLSSDVHSINVDGKESTFVKENGPRSLRVLGGERTLQLACDVGLKDRIIAGDPLASKGRMLYVDGKLHMLPRSVSGALQSPLIRRLVPSILKEPFQRNRTMVHSVAAGDNDESVFQFFQRRFGQFAADVFASSICLGIYAANARVLSLEATFPALREWERRYGSVCAGAVASMLRRSRTSEDTTVKEQARSSVGEGLWRELKESGIFSFRDGLQDLPLALMNEISKSDLARVVHADCECLELSSDGGFSVALENGDVHRVQHAISALPAWSLAKCVQSSVDPRLQELGRTAARIKFSDVAVVTLCFRKKQLQGGLPHAFGYLVPPRELQPIIGVTFDSQCFPAHHRSGDELIRLTAMLGGDASIAQLQRELCADTDKRILDLSCQSHRDESFLVDVATSSVREHLGIVGEAVFSHASVLQQGIPLYDVRWKFVPARA